MPSLVIYDWSQYTTSLTQSELETSTHGNDPGQSGANNYDAGSPTWTGVDFTFNGGSGSVIDINDDDASFQDAYVETGGAQTLNAPVTINGVTYAAGSVVENEFSLIDPSGNEVWVVRIAGVNVGFAYPEGNPPTAGDVFNANDTRDGDPADSLDQTTGSEEAYANLACFLSGTLIRTARGEVPVETLRAGDRVSTLDDGPQPLIWTGSRALGAVELQAQPHLRPVLVPAGVLGNPTDLCVSPQHCLLLGPTRGLACPALARAKHLAVAPGPIRIARGKRSVRYHHLFFARHQLVWSNGALSESFYPGPEALRALRPADRRFVADWIGGPSGTAPGLAYGPRVRPVLPRREVLSLNVLRGGRASPRCVERCGKAGLHLFAGR